MKSQPTAEQLAALTSYATAHGRRWKSELRQAWTIGDYDHDDNAPLLQQIRNAFGPSWLVRFKLPACTECNAQTQEECICDPLNHTVSGGYVVTWEMDIDASTPQQAAQQAFEHMQRPGTSANVFDVADEDGNITRVDLEELRQQTPTPSGSEQSKTWTAPNAKAFLTIHGNSTVTAPCGCLLEPEIISGDDGAAFYQCETHERATSPALKAAIRKLRRTFDGDSNDAEHDAAVELLDLLDPDGEDEN